MTGGYPHAVARRFVDLGVALPSAQPGPFRHARHAHGWLSVAIGPGAQIWKATPFVG